MHDGASCVWQIHLFLLKVFHVYGVPPPKVLGYDDACHLKKFLENRADKDGATFARWVLDNMDLAVDKCAAAALLPRCPCRPLLLLHARPAPLCPQPTPHPSPRCAGSTGPITRITATARRTSTRASARRSPQT